MKRAHAEEVSSMEKGSRSFLKWAGGKTRYARLLTALAPDSVDTYREPFMGSAAVFFELQPENAELSDMNEDLVVCFQQIKDDPFAVMDVLDQMPNTPQEYEVVRRRDRTKLDPVERAAIVIYLNKTSFRGLWRVNRKGEFNVPYGGYDRPYYNRDTLLSASKTLQNATIKCVPYADALADASSGDWVYLDPPYVPTGEWGDFTRYTPDRFPADAHEKLAADFASLTEKGVKAVLTNSDTRFVRSLYRDFPMWAMSTRRDIDLRSSERASRDLVVANYEPSLPRGISELQRVRSRRQLQVLT